MKKKYNLTLVLGGGGARGMAHIGVLRILEQNNIVPNYILGTSAGALTGGLYAAGTLNEFEKALVGKTKKQIRKILHFWPSRDSLIKTDRLKKELEVYTKNKKIEELSKSFACTAVDLLTGKKILIDKGDLCEAILASIAIPLLFPPVYRDNMLLADGGVADPLPIQDGLKDAKKVIAVNINRPLDKLQKKNKYNFLDILERALNIVQDEMTRKALKRHRKNLIVISPNVDDINTLDFHKTSEAVKAGEDETLKRMEEIKKFVLEE
jgi:NTE family protein